MKSKRIFLIVGVAVLLVAGVGFWYWQSKRAVSTMFTTNIPVPTLGSTIFEKTQSSLKGQVPDTNPFSDQKNPLDVIYQNPFK